MNKVSLFAPPLPTSKNSSLYWQHLAGASVGLALAQALQQHDVPTLLIAPDSLTVTHLLEALHFFSQTPERFLSFPDWETLPYDHFSPHQDIISDRLSVLYRLPSFKNETLITTIGTLLHRLPPRTYLDAQSFMLQVGNRLNIDEFRQRLINTGYHHVSQVREHGDFAVRGSIIDLFPMGSKQPFRIDLLDDEVDTIRFFSPETQRSQEKIPAIRLLPAKEYPLTAEAIDRFRQNWRSAFGGNPLQSPMYQDITEGIAAPGIEYYLPLFFAETATLFDYLPQNTLIITFGNIQIKANEFMQEVQLRYEQNKFDITKPLLPPEKIFLTTNILSHSIDAYPRLHINEENISQKILSKNNVYEFATKRAPTLEINHKASQPLAALKDYLTKNIGRILFCAETLGRREVLLQLFRGIQLSPTFFPDWNAFIQSKDQYGIAVSAIEDGFSLEEPSLTIFAETELYGKRVMQRRLRKKTQQDTDGLIRDLTELQLNDPVVHIDHGVGRYLGLQTLTVGDQIGEFLCLEYQGGDKLYVPVASLQLISRYSGADPEHSPINKLGTEQWQRAKRKAAEKVRDVAAELLELYANRAARSSVPYHLPEDQYAIFAAQFPFEETPDQLQAIESVFKDMQSAKPMDRVICGDVGFGKTEVALRAAFLAVQNGKQVALLVPTTLLAQQHFQNFQDRFADWPIQVEMLSRFRTSKEQKNVLQRLADGKVDIIIGTHKLLQADIAFKSLGLVIIDEEHRFGVKQKEKLKALRANVDILTLTATPIPRTLNMALSGIRDLSIIATPPARRLSVKTFVHEYQNQLVQEAIAREIMRGGQVYFLHNDVSTINKKADEIRQLVPEARVSVAHGQLHERDLERVMSEFYHRHFNVLVCSTIIESGIDIPTANTIIIHRADKFGIAQLHQLRGRVGRSHHQAYAYLLVPSRDQISADAEKRLDAIATLGELGIGFTLSTHDLEIRGAGELLGEGQSGNMHEIGFTLYMDLLSRAVEALKAGEEPIIDESFAHRGMEIDLRIPALIPEHYLPDVQLRLQFYKRIANAKIDRELEDIQVEMIDRFGLLPDYLKNLFAIAQLKLKIAPLSVIKLEANDKNGKIEFQHNTTVKPETIIHLIQNEPQHFRLEGPTKLRFNLPPHENKERVLIIEKVMQRLLE